MNLFDDALRRFKRAVTKAGTLQETRKREFYEKPSVKRKRKSEAARKRKNLIEYKNRLRSVFCFSRKIEEKKPTF